MATTKNANQMTLPELFAAYRKINAERGLILHTFLSMASDAPTYEAWEGYRVTFGADRRAANPNVKDDAVNTAWHAFQRAAQEYAVDNGYDFTLPAKPKATSDAAVKKAEQRKAPEVVEKCETLEQLAAVDTTDAAVLLAVTEKRAKLESAAIKATIKLNGAKAKEEQDKFIAYFKALTTAGKQDYYDLRDKRFDRVLAHIPSDTITTALTAIKALEKAAKPSKQKTDTAPL